jgi:hypothetical protein
MSIVLPNVIRQVNDRIIYDPAGAAVHPDPGSHGLQLSPEVGE